MNILWIHTHSRVHITFLITKVKKNKLCFISEHYTYTKQTNMRIVSTQQ